MRLSVDELNTLDT